MPFVKKNKIDFNIVQNKIILTPEYIKQQQSKFKKITGSRIAAILGKNTFVSPTKAWAIMVGIYVDTVDQFFTQAGAIIEPKIHKIVCDKLNINFKQYNPFAIKWDVFKENEIFGGIPDGEPVDEKGNLLYPQLPMLEIKTTSIDAYEFKKINNQMVLQKDNNGYPIIKAINKKKEKWFDQDGNIVIPIDYQFQLGLYCYLRQIEKGIFAICFLETPDYINPSMCEVANRELHLVDYKVDLKEFQLFIDYARNWYEQHIKNGISPELTAADLEWLKYEL